MKERPILFSTDMVKAILDGRKTQTRRVIKPQPSIKKLIDFGIQPHRYRNTLTWWHPKYGFHDIDNTMLEHCPYGQVGDRLWVRETWMHFGHVLDNKVFVHYKASINQNGGERLLTRWKDEPIEITKKWQPSIFMPRKYSRITLEITEVRVERLQEITEMDACNEGVDWYSIVNKLDNWGRNQQAFRKLWNSLNAKRGYGWDVNPWVWVLSFNLSGEQGE